MSKSGKQSVPTRFFRKKFETFFRKYIALIRMLVVCGLFSICLTFLLRQQVYRINLHDDFPTGQIEISYPTSEEFSSIEVETQWLRAQRDEDYVHQALQLEEPVEIKYILADEIEQETAFPNKIPDTSLMQSLPQAKQMEAEEDYSRYEEELPHNIIEEVRHPKVSKIEIKVFSKPPYFGPEPVIAIVIDDMGDNYKRTKDITSLQAPLTASFLTYPARLEQQIAASLKSGHEIMLHVPMQPKSNINLSKDILTVEMSPAEVRTNFEKMLNRFTQVKGINNHMGSRLTEDEKRMAEIMKVLKAKGLFFLDSKTTPHSVGDKVARKYDVAYASRNVFLDNKNDVSYILKQLAHTENIARKNGYAVAIGHPKSQTYEALKRWLPTLEGKHLKLVPLSHIVSALNSPAN